MPILARVAGYALDMTNPYASGRDWAPNEERSAAVVLHAVSIVLELIAPIAGYAILKDKGPFIQHHAKEQLNFALTILIIYAALAISIVGWLIFWVVPVYATVFRIIAAAQASQGNFYKFPLTIRFIK